MTADAIRVSFACTFLITPPAPEGCLRQPHRGPRSRQCCRPPSPEPAPSLRWEILGPGWSAEQFTTSLLRHSNQRITSIASRGVCRARAFADRFSILHAYGDVEAMLASPKVDVVYSATPHVIHAKAAIAALRAGKDVLVVKPLAMNPAEGTEVACVAAEEGPFAMEALWTRFLPVSDCVRQLLERGRLGVICPPSRRSRRAFRHPTQLDASSILRSAAVLRSTSEFTSRRSLALCSAQHHRSDRH